MVYCDNSTIVNVIIFSWNCNRVKVQVLHLTNTQVHTFQNNI